MSADDTDDNTTEAGTTDDPVPAVTGTDDPAVDDAPAAEKSDDPAAPEPTDGETGGETGGRLRRWIVAGLAALVAAAAIAALVMLSLGEYHHRQNDALRAEAVQTSHDYLVAMAAFDYQKMDAARDQIVAESTPGFAAKYDEMVKALRDIVVSSKGVATATAEHVAVESLDGDTATVVAFVDQHVTNVTAPQGSDQKYRMVVKLVRSGDRWIVDDVQTV
ncbi:mce associated protein mas1a [Mycobacterium sp. TNTM28]|uniref:Mce associated protein mas1a n=1 Tax=[Mycobacterium] fortunisiensis TaxID=2600579 RepID=A0ABS6KSP6_9MYCO|nr:mce associated protein mas1a [[Mycobacterium] fortunisiensis]MBU9766665.1 mce associated protein mas1a [[Mycobacterium] fortunisiensis]